MDLTKEIKVLDIIISFVKAIQNTPKTENGKPCFYMYDGENKLWGAKYLLGQILRQFEIN